VAHHLGVGKRVIYGLIRTGTLPAYRVGHAYRVRVTDLEALRAYQGEDA